MSDENAVKHIHVLSLLVVSVLACTSSILFFHYALALDTEQTEESVVWIRIRVMDANNVPYKQATVYFDEVNQGETRGTGRTSWFSTTYPPAIHSYRIVKEGYPEAMGTIEITSENLREYLIVLQELPPNNPPVADAGGPYLGSEETAILLDGSKSHDPDGQIEKYQWDFGDGTIGSSETPYHRYDQDGNYTITLTVTDDRGAVESDSTTAIITDTQPLAAFSASPLLGSPPLTVIFLDESSSNDGIATWLWNFGDGMTSMEQHPSHTYLMEGNYSVSLTVTEHDEDSDTVTTIDYITLIEDYIVKAPTVTLLPATQQGFAGTTLNYTVYVTNNDLVSSASSFTLTHSLPEGWSAFLNTSRLTLSPGSTGVSLFTVTSPLHTQPMNYTLSITATNDANTSYQGTGSAIYQIQSRDIGTNLTLGIHPTVITQGAQIPLTLSGQLVQQDTDIGLSNQSITLEWRDNKIGVRTNESGEYWYQIGVGSYEVGVFWFTATFEGFENGQHFWLPSSTSANFTVSRSAPDIAVIDVAWVPTDPNVEEQMRFTCTVENLGTVDVIGVTATLRIDGQEIQRSSDLSLRGGEAQTVAFQTEWTATEGSHEIEVVIDDVNTLIETDETNNVLLKTLHIDNPTFLFASFSWLYFLGLFVVINLIVLTIWFLTRKSTSF